MYNKTCEPNGLNADYPIGYIINKRPSKINIMSRDMHDFYTGIYVCDLAYDKMDLAYVHIKFDQ